jgi:hypothetical protein
MTQAHTVEVIRHSNVIARFLASVVPIMIRELTLLERCSWGITVGTTV